MWGPLKNVCLFHSFTVIYKQNRERKEKPTTSVFQWNQSQPHRSQCTHYIHPSTKRQWKHYASVIPSEGKDPETKVSSAPWRCHTPVPYSPVAHPEPLHIQHNFQPVGDAREGGEDGSSPQSKICSGSATVSSQSFSGLSASVMKDWQRSITLKPRHKFSRIIFQAWARLSASLNAWPYWSLIRSNGLQPVGNLTWWVHSRTPGNVLLDQFQLSFML